MKAPILQTVVTKALVRANRFLCLLVLATCVACSPEMPASEDLDLLRAVNAMDEERQDLARDYLERIRAREADDPLVLRLRARAWSSGTLQSSSYALDSWRALLVLAPGDAEARLGAARALFTLGEWAGASEAVEGLDDPQARILRLRALAEIDIEAAAAEIPGFLQEVDETHPRAATTYAAAARVSRQAGDQEAAIGYARLAIELDPLDRPSRYLLARLLQGRGEHEAAMGHLELHQLLSRLESGGSLSKISESEQLELLNQVLEHLDETPLALRQELIRLWIATGRRKQAADALEELAGGETLPPQQFLEWSGLAERAGQRGIARDLLETSLDTVGSDKGESPAWRSAIFGLALLEYRGGDAEASRLWLNEGLAEAPGCARYHALLARLDLEAGADDEAAEHFERALELAPWRADTRLELANLLLSQGRLDEALRWATDAPEENVELRRFAQRHGRI